MTEFPFWPTESLLLGLCLGEYEAREKALFSSILFDRLLPFFPSFACSVRNEDISEDEVSPDVRWAESFASGTSVGYSTKEPDCLYTRQPDDTIVRSTYLPPKRRSLFDFVLESVLPYCAFRGTEAEKWMHSGTLRSKILFEALQGPKLFLSREHGTERRSAIIRTVSELARTSGDIHLFDSGKSFGGLLAALDRFAADVSYDLIDPPDDEDQVTLDISAMLNDILASDLVRDNHYAEAAMRTLMGMNFQRPIQRSEFDPDGLEADHYHTLHLSNSAISYFWMAFGEVLGVLRDPDQEYADRDIASVNPRSLAWESASSDRLRQRLDLAIRDLTDHADEVGRPEAVISGTYQIIEGLTKRVWPESWKSQPRTRCSAVLGSKLHSFAPDSERRFAGTAKNLQQTYRNIASHDPDAFECSVAEAMYFVNGLRVLVDLWERIEQERAEAND